MLSGLIALAVRGGDAAVLSVLPVMTSGDCGSQIVAHVVISQHDAPKRIAEIHRRARFCCGRPLTISTLPDEPTRSGVKSS